MGDMAAEKTSRQMLNEALDDVVRGLAVAAARRDHAAMVRRGLRKASSDADAGAVSPIAAPKPKAKRASHSRCKGETD
jgi:hypothetical protein